MNQLIKGQRIAYKGDMCNESGVGAIVEVKADKFARAVYSMGPAGLSPIDSSKAYVIALDDGRLFQEVYADNIGGDFGNKSKRFMLEPGQADDAEIANLLAAKAIRDANIKAKADEAAAVMAAAMAQADVAGRALGLIPEAEFKAAGKRGSAAAYNLRAHLKARGIKASVKQDGYSCINVWVKASDHPMAQMIALAYKAGDFDGMVDCYNYDPSAWGRVFGDVQYVFVYNERD